MTKARKFKKKVALKPTRKKESAVFSVELIRKETLQKLNGYWKKVASKFKSV